MKNLTKIKALLAVLMIAFCFYTCKKDQNAGEKLNIGQTNLANKPVNISQVNLVADTAGFGAARIDTNLLNAWGIAATPNGRIWISANHKGLSVIYDKMGQMVKQPVTIPSIAPGQTGAPDGVIFNNTTEFGGNKFIFASEDGIIAAWKSGDSAMKVADRSALNTVYKGITMASDGSACFLYLTNFKGGKIDVFDKDFNYVTDKPFIDPNMPAGFAPFNIQNIDGSLYVTYAKQKEPDHMDDQAGPGNGYIDVFTPKGILIKRFASQGSLNSPWGIVVAPKGFAGDERTILIGNFGDGRINIFNMGGHFKGQLQSGGQSLAIDGLWAIDFLKDSAGNDDSDNLLYFTAGPNKESHGLFGYLKKE